MVKMTCDVIWVVLTWDMVTGWHERVLSVLHACDWSVATNQVRNRHNSNLAQPWVLGLEMTRTTAKRGSPSLPANQRSGPWQRWLSAKLHLQTVATGTTQALTLVWPDNIQPWQLQHSGKSFIQLKRIGWPKIRKGWLTSINRHLQSVSIYHEISHKFNQPLNKRPLNIQWYLIRFV